MKLTSPSGLVARDWSYARKLQISLKETPPISFDDYLLLVDWTGRQIRENKRGSIDQHLPPILLRINIDPDVWMSAMQPNGNLFSRAMGKLNHLQLHAKALGQAWVKGLKQAERLYP